MFKRTLRPVFLLTLLVALGLTACEADRGATGPIDAPVARTEGSGGWITMVSTASEVSDTSVVQVVGREGGIIRLGDHSLMIPSRVLDEDLEFTMRVVGGGEIKTDLSARRVRDGNEVNSFSSALILKLSYKNATVTNPWELVNVYVEEDGDLEPLRSYVSTITKTVQSPIRHFSIYGMAIR